MLAPLRARLIEPGAAETVPIARAAGHVLAADLTSPVAVPPFANSQMDGYAVRASDVASASAGAPVRLPIGAASAAGDPIGVHVVGTASPVMTGAPVPDGADAVIPIEQCDPAHFIGLGSAAHADDVPPGATVGFAAPVEPGTFVRGTGTDLAPGAIILPAGTRLTPAALGSIAAAGLAEVAVRPRAHVLLLSTGHELRAPGAPLGSGQIYDANSSSMSAALAETGVDVTTATSPDDAEALLTLIAAHPDADLVVTMGGVSAGAFEVVRDALEPAGVRFGHVAMQPGGPQGLGLARIGERELPVVAFPGNPVSVLVSFEMFLRPILCALSERPALRPAVQARLAHAITSPAGKHQVRRGALREDGSVEVGGPSSHLLHDYARATVLAHVPIGVDALPAGAEVEIWRIDE
nr:gephyrin-like molybdotransferase Glp [Microbacterium pseudoresistens]